MRTQRDILCVSTPAAVHPSDAGRTMLPLELDESPSIVPAEPLKSEAAPDVLKPEQARARFEAFRKFATSRRHCELAAKASAGPQHALENNVQQLKTALNLIERCLPDCRWSIERAIERAREKSRRPSELKRASKLREEFDRLKPAMTPANQFGIRVREILAAAELKPSEAARVMHLGTSTIYRWMSGKLLPVGTIANRRAAATLENLAKTPEILQPLLRPTWGTVERPSHIPAKRWRSIHMRLRRGGHCDLKGTELSEKINELLATPNKPQRAPYRLPQDLSRWPAVPRAEIEAYRKLTQLRSEPKWATNR